MRGEARAVGASGAGAPDGRDDAQVSTVPARGIAAEGDAGDAALVLARFSEAELVELAAAIWPDDARPG